MMLFLMNRLSPHRKRLLLLCQCLLIGMMLFNEKTTPHRYFAMFSLLPFADAKLVRSSTHRGLPRLYLFHDDSPETKMIHEIRAPVDFSLALSLKPRLVLFYSPSKGPSIRYRETFIALTKQLLDNVDSRRTRNNDKWKVYAISCEVHETMCQKYGPGPNVPLPVLRVTFDNGSTWHTLPHEDSTENIIQELQRLRSAPLEPDDRLDANITATDRRDRSLSKNMAKNDEQEQEGDGQLQRPDADEDDLDEDNRIVVDASEDVQEDSRANESEQQDSEDPGSVEEQSSQDDSDETNGSQIPDVEDKEQLSDKTNQQSYIDPKVKGVIKEQLQSKLNHNRKRSFSHGSRDKKPKHDPFLVAHKTAQSVENATVSMISHRIHSKEYWKRRQAILDRIESKKGRVVRSKIEERWKEIDHSQGQYKLPFRKQLKRARWVERVPVVKRAVEMTPEEQLMLDTTLSFMHGLTYGVYRNAGSLSTARKNSLKDWLELLSATLPEEWGIHVTIDDLLVNFNSIVRSEDEFKAVLNRHPLKRREWSRSCTESGRGYSGFSCGLWKLLHVVSVGLAEHVGGQTLIDSGLRKPDARLFSPAEAAEVMRNYIEHFFTCGVCVKKFLQIYQNCDNQRRCTRLVRYTKGVITDADWKEPAKWLWELHNEINVQLLKERALKKKDDDNKKKKEGDGDISVISALWPSLDDCVTCFHWDGDWNEDSVFVYLELEYWPQSEDFSKMGRLLELDQEFDNNTREHGLFWILIVVGIFLLYSFQGNKRALQQTILLNVRRNTVKMDPAAAQKRSE